MRIITGCHGWFLCFWGASLAHAQDATYSQINLLDDERVLEVGDRFLFLVEEEREPEIIVFVNGRGYVKLPLIGEVPAMRKTERTLAQHIPDELERPFFYQAAVILNRIADMRYDGRFVLVRAARS